MMYISHHIMQNNAFTICIKTIMWTCQMFENKISLLHLQLLEISFCVRLTLEYLYKIVIFNQLHESPVREWLCVDGF